MKNKKNYLIIIGYGILLILCLVGFNNIYGSSVDWITQHTVIPDYFRKLFYETHRLVPNLAFELGGGQNIFNYSYYGLLNPVFLISFFFPSLSMQTFVIIASIILYLLSGILSYKFFQKHMNPKQALLFSLIMMSFSPISFHFHYHIMFVWYYPFLVLALMGVDRYFEKHSSLQLIVWTTLLFFMNYYYGVTSLLVVGVYSLYLILTKYDKWKDIVKQTFLICLRLCLTVLLAAIILIPTAVTIIGSKRSGTIAVDFGDLFIFNIKESMYSPFGIGLTFIFILAIVTNLLTKKKKKEDLFLNGILALITLLPVFMYVLNGFLYARGKVLIPFIILFCLSLNKFFENLKSKQINLSTVFFCAIIILICGVIFNCDSVLVIVFLIDAIATLVVILRFSRKYNVLTIFALITILLSTIGSNYNAKYLTKDKYKEIVANDALVNKLLAKVNDDDYFRIDSNIGSNKNSNKIYNRNFFNASIYSSTYNHKYSDFYNFKMGNNIPNRNSFVQSGTNNSLFHSFMGVKYLIAENYDSIDYDLVKKNKKYGLYKNDKVRPLVYVDNNLSGEKQYQSLSFPYSLEFMLKNSVVGNSKPVPYKSSIKKINDDFEASYLIDFAREKKYTYKLSEPIKDKYLIVEFDVLANQSCQDGEFNGDVFITINGVKNKLTCKDWYYFNDNKHFEYVLSSKEGIDELNILFSRGKYRISDINLYSMEKVTKDITKVDKLKIDKGDSEITGKVKLPKNNYIITSLPYDRGFSVFVDGKKVKSEIVNEAFLGFKVNKGSHDFKIKYEALYFNISVCISLGSLGLAVLLLFLEKRNFEKNK